jgi:hypothetical protein
MFMVGDEKLLLGEGGAGEEDGREGVSFEFCQTLGSGAVFGTMLRDDAVKKRKSGVHGMRKLKASLHGSSCLCNMAMRRE